MSQRLVAAVIVVGAIGLILLSLRQQRIAMVHSMSTLHARMTIDQAALWRARAEVADAIQPGTLTIPSGIEYRPGLPGPDWQTTDGPHD